VCRFFVYFGGERLIKELRINEEIRVAEVRLVDGDESVVVPIKVALQHAQEKGLDLVEISPSAKPPVCRVMDYGKYRFDQIKRAKEQKKNQKAIQVKEVKFRPSIEDHDFETKAKAAERFLADGDKVRATVMFRGREITHADNGRAICAKLIERLSNVGVVEKNAKLEGKNMTIIFAPKTNK